MKFFIAFQYPNMEIFIYCCNFLEQNGFRMDRCVAGNIRGECRHATLPRHHNPPFPPQARWRGALQMLSPCNRGSDVQEAPVIKNYFPGGWHHYDKEGRPVFLLRLGQMDAKGIIRSIGEEGLTKLVLHVCEEGLKLTEESAHRHQQPISQWTMLLDLGRMEEAFCALFYASLLSVCLSSVRKS